MTSSVSGADADVCDGPAFGDAVFVADFGGGVEAATEFSLFLVRFRLGGEDFSGLAFASVREVGVLDDARVPGTFCVEFSAFELGFGRDLRSGVDQTSLSNALTCRRLFPEPRSVEVEVLLESEAVEVAGDGARFRARFDCSGVACVGGIRSPSL